MGDSCWNGGYVGYAGTGRFGVGLPSTVMAGGRTHASKISDRVHANISSPSGNCSPTRLAPASLMRHTVLCTCGPAPHELE